MIATTNLRKPSVAHGAPAARHSSESRRRPTDRSVIEHRHLVELAPAGDRTPLFCIHPIDGELNIYRQLVRNLPVGLPVFGLKAGPVSGAPARLPDMTARYADEMLHSGQSQPFRLIGFSMGAVVAMHVAAELEARGAAVDFVAVVDYRPLTSSNWRTQRDCLAAYIETVHRNYCGRMAMLRELPPDELRATTMEMASQVLGDGLDTSIEGMVAFMTGSPLYAEGLRAEYIRPIIERLFARMPMLKTSQLRRLKAPLHVWRAADGIGVGRDDWSAWTDADCEESLLPGNHLTVMQKPAIGKLARQLTELIEQFDDVSHFAA